MCVNSKMKTLSAKESVSCFGISSGKITEHKLVRTMTAGCVLEDTCIVQIGEGFHIDDHIKAFHIQPAHILIGCTLAGDLLLGIGNWQMQCASSTVIKLTFMRLSLLTNILLSSLSGETYRNL